jgi:predicted aspartyl protease
VIKSIHKGVVYHANVDAFCDTGCSVSMISRKLLPKVKIEPCVQSVCAANGSQINIQGKARIHFDVQGLKLTADVLVSDDIQELYLGIDWLKQNDCRWQLAGDVLFINDVQVPLVTKICGSFLGATYVCVDFDEALCVTAPFSVLVTSASSRVTPAKVSTAGKAQSCIVSHMRIANIASVGKPFPHTSFVDTRPHETLSAGTHARPSDM